MIHHHTIGDARITGVIEYSGPTHAPDFLYPAVDKAERDAVLKANAAWLAPNHYVPHMDRLIVTIQLWVRARRRQRDRDRHRRRQPQAAPRPSAWTGSTPW